MKCDTINAAYMIMIIQVIKDKHANVVQDTCEKEVTCAEPILDILYIGPYVFL